MSMITINLLPVAELRQKRRARRLGLAYAAFVVGLVIVCGLVKALVMDPSLEALRAERGDGRAELAELDRQLAEARQVTVATVGQWRRLAAVLELEERRRDQTRLLVELEERLPKEKAWLMSLTHQNGQLSIEGLATDQEAVSRFLGRLENAAHLDPQSVDLVEIAQNMVINDLKLAKFTIAARSVFPRPGIIEEGLPAYGLPSRADFIKLVAAAAPPLAEELQPAPPGGRTGPE